MGLHLLLRQAQADAGDVVLLYADESVALTHPYLAHPWAEMEGRSAGECAGPVEEGCHDGRARRGHG